jgi:hypothetical protein
MMALPQSGGVDVNVWWNFNGAGLEEGRLEETCKMGRDRRTMMTYLSRPILTPNTIVLSVLIEGSHCALDDSI